MMKMPPPQHIWWRVLTLSLSLSLYLSLSLSLSRSLSLALSLSLSLSPSLPLFPPLSLTLTDLALEGGAGSTTRGGSVKLTSQSCRERCD